MNLREFASLQEKLETYQRGVEQAKGAAQQIKLQLQKEFDCETLKEAKSLLEKIQRNKERLQKELEEELQAFEEKWRDKI